MNPKLKNIFKYVSLAIICIVLLTVIIFKQAFGTKEEIIEIEQLIGGKLICESKYMDDIQSWYYFIDYKYKDDNGKLFKIGQGEYFGRDWEKSEQLKKISNWVILQTGGEFKSDKLLIGKLDSNNWKTFEISPNNIEKDKLWISKNINSKTNWSPRESFISSFKDDKIEVEYLYRIGEKVEEQETRLITYKFNKETGIPEMTKIE